MSNESFLTLALSRLVVMRALKVAILIGSILVLINHGEKIMVMTISPKDCLKMILTYLVPYGVSTWSAVMAIRENPVSST